MKKILVIIFVSILILQPQIVLAADITVDTGDTSPIAGFNAPRALVWTSASVGYFFYIDSDNDFKYAKTVDGGANWSAAVAEIDSDTTITALVFDVWYDQWTPGDSGTTIHIWWSETDLDDISYRALNTSNDSFGNKIQVASFSTAASARGNFVSGTKAKGGNLYVVGTVDAAAECEFARSTDGGGTWDLTRVSPLETCADQGFLFPGNAADTNDIWMLYDDIDAEALTLKANDDSADSWSESVASAPITDDTTLGTGEYPFSGSIRQSDGHLIVATHSALDNAATDFEMWDINGTGSFTALTDITTNIDDNYYSSVYINQSTDDIYISYAGKRDGSETLGTTVGVYYTKSTDDGANWTANDTAYSESTGNYRQNWAGMMGNRFGVVWRNDATEGLLFNFVNSLDLTPIIVPTNLEQVAYRWFANDNSTDVGRAGGASTPITAPKEGTPIRLRLLFHVNGSDLASSGTTTKMQLGEKPGGGCSAATFGDVGGLTDITWIDNSVPTDGTALTFNTEDPRHAATTSSHAVINQTYNESNNFSNTQGAVDAGADMLFDFAFSVSTTSTDISAKGGKTYCFRAVQAAGGSLAFEGGGGYTVYPELTIEKMTKVRLRGAIRLRVVRLR